MSSQFANRRKPRKIGGDDEENDADEQGWYLRSSSTLRDGYTN